MKGSSLETALEKVSRILSKQYGLRLVCEGDMCRTDGRTIYLPSLPDDVPEELLGAIRGWADHEASHAIYTNIRMATPFREEHGQQAFDILNGLEDARVERLMGRRFPGAAINLRQAFAFVGEMAQRGDLADADPFAEFVSALYTRASGKPDQPWIAAEGYAMADRFTQELSEVHACRSTRQVGELALRIWHQIAQSSQSDQEPSEGTDPGPADGDGSEGQGDRRRAPSDAQSAPSQADANDTSTPDAQDDQGHARSPMERLGQVIQSELRQHRTDEYGPYSVYTRQYDFVDTPQPSRHFDYRAELGDLGPYVSGLRRRLIQTLAGRKETLWLGDRTRGSLDPRSLHRLVTCQSSRIFRRRVETDAGRTACTLLLDLSSSMSGKPIRLCRQLGLLFADVLSVLGFPTEIIGFSTFDTDVRGEAARKLKIEEAELAKRYTRFCPLYYLIVKAFDEPWRQIAGRFGSVHPKHLTPLGESLLFAGKRLSQRPEKRKVLFCLTDGKPVVGAVDEMVTFNHACDAVRRLTRAGIEPVGIGIVEPCVADIFSRHVVINSLDDLAQGFLKELCAVLTNR